MKRILILLFTIIILLKCGCIKQKTDGYKESAIPTQQFTEQFTQEPTEQPSKDIFTYDDLLNIKNKVHRIVDGIEPYSLKDAYEEFRIDTVVAVTKILSIKYYYGWEEDGFFDGWTTVEALVLEVKDEFNSAGVKPGDILQLREDSWLFLENYEETIAFFADKYNTNIADKEDFKDFMKDKDGFFQLVPQKGIDYSLSLWPDEYPLIVGERYAMFCCMSDETTEYGMPESFLFHVYPMDRWIDLEGLVSNYGFDLCDEYITVSKQLAALFRHTEHIGESMIK